MDEQTERAGLSGGQGGDEAAPAWRGSSFEAVEPWQARVCHYCKEGHADAAHARACELAHRLTFTGLLRGNTCPLCGDAYPYHKRDCASGPKYCGGCGGHTTHCDDGHCQECCIDDENYPIEDCGACAYRVGTVVHVRDDGEQLPEPGEVYDLIPNPFED